MPFHDHLVMTIWRAQYFERRETGLFKRLNGSLQRYEANMFPVTANRRRNPGSNGTPKERPLSNRFQIKFGVPPGQEESKPRQGGTPEGWEALPSLSANAQY